MGFGKTCLSAVVAWLLVSGTTLRSTDATAEVEGEASGALETRLDLADVLALRRSRLVFTPSESASMRSAGTRNIAIVQLASRAGTRVLRHARGGQSG